MKGFTCCSCGKVTEKSNVASSKEWQKYGRRGAPVEKSSEDREKSTKKPKKDKAKKIEKKQRGRGG